jgi:ribosome biogenesis GTPase
LTFPLTETLLQRLGWDDGWEAAFEPYRADGYAPARVAVQHRGAYDLIGDDGEIRARAAARLVKADELPAVGDWVVLDLERGLVEGTLPRRTALSRKEAWQVTREQVLAANVDVAFLVQALPLDVNLRRLERYLATAWESGAQPVVLLTKTDLVEDVEPWTAAVETVTLGSCAVVALSPRTGDHVDDVRPFFDGNQTAVLLGSSGVGKSTLVNALLGEELLPTQDVRADDHAGRHTTSHRELILLPGGGVVLDTPGIRELHLWDADLDSTFGDVEELARGCRFTDCSHDREPGCAVRAALADGTLPRERWESYVKLQRELEAVERKRNALARREYRRQFKIREREQRRKRR